ncbi:MAG: hypothetical protein HY944_06240 [Gemmatimonadetes bacterium]|nr:hypothetical protein [Gemmatimonadota bacterium]
MLAALILALTLSSDSVRFPVVTSDNLEGRTFTLPRDFDGERNVVFIAFKREQQREVDSWVPFVKPLLARTPGTEYYEIPTIKRMVAPMRWMINRGMRGGIDDRGARERTITLYLDKEPFKRALGIATEQEIHVLVVDREGNVRWRTAGAFSEDKGQGLARALTSP